MFSEAVRDYLWHHQRLSTITSEIIYGSLRDPSQPPQRGGVPKWQRRRRRFPASQQRIRSAHVAGVTLGSVTSYISTIVGAEQLFRPQQRIGGNVGGDASQRRNST